MKRMLALASLTLAFVGCHVHQEVCHYNAQGVYHCHDSHEDTTYYPESSGGYNNYIIVEEEEWEYCDDTIPYDFDPEYCTYGSQSCCTWKGSEYGWEETWCFDDCEWSMHSYQLVADYF